MLDYRRSAFGELVYHRSAFGGVKYWVGTPIIKGGRNEEKISF
jgi:hypothetical protein